MSLPVLSVKPPKRPLAKSKMGKWRALVLILVQLAIAGHIVLWVATGMRSTLSPVEPSEAMYTLEQGLVNAGFVFFVLAILSVFVLGRFFCGWGCHVVALQDLCTWAMEKVGVRPRPFRSRLLVWAPLGLAIYMFVWPTFNREVFKPVMTGLGWWDTVAPFVRDAPPPIFRAGQDLGTFFRPAFVKTNFWETFAAWYVAIPFLIVCGFAAVYFLGSKGFCTYGCPYGGFFGPADRLAPGRIRVTDACEHCGHCTAACTSNVRVHEEVRDYGMVVDPGCMKCLDCVSVCPTDALYFGFGKPAAFAKRRAGAAPAKRFKSRVYDLTLREEIAAGVLFVFLFIAYTKLAYAIPLLMAMGMAGIGTFLAWKAWRLFRDPSVRLQSLQLKLKGRWMAWGFACAALAGAMLALAGWSAAVKASKLRGRIIDQRLSARLDFENVFNAAYRPAPEDKARAERALALYRFGAAPADGGIGWADIELLRRMAWMSAVAGDAEGARRRLTRGIELAAGHDVDVDDLLNALVQVSAMQGRTPQDFAAELREILARSPRAPVRVALAGLQLQLGDAPGAAESARRAAADHPRDPRTASLASRVLIQAGQAAAGVSLLEPHILRHPRDGGLRADYAAALANAGRMDEALEQVRYAAELDTRNPGIPALFAEFLHHVGRHDEAAGQEARAREREKQLHESPAGAPARPVTDSGTR